MPNLILAECRLPVKQNFPQHVVPSEDEATRPRKIPSTRKASNPYAEYTERITFPSWTILTRAKGLPVNWSDAMHVPCQPGIVFRHSPMVPSAGLDRLAERRIMPKTRQQNCLRAFLAVGSLLRKKQNPSAIGQVTIIAALARLSKQSTATALDDLESHGFLKRTGARYKRYELRDGDPARFAGIRQTEFLMNRTKPPKLSRNLSRGSKDIRPDQTTTGFDRDLERERSYGQVLQTAPLGPEILAAIRRREEKSAKRIERDLERKGQISVKDFACVWNGMLQEMFDLQFYRPFNQMERGMCHKFLQEQYPAKGNEMYEWVQECGRAWKQLRQEMAKMKIGVAPLPYFSSAFAYRHWFWARVYATLAADTHDEEYVTLLKREQTLSDEYIALKEDQWRTRKTRTSTTKKNTGTNQPTRSWPESESRKSTTARVSKTARHAAKERFGG